MNLSSKRCLLWSVFQSGSIGSGCRLVFQPAFVGFLMTGGIQQEICWFPVIILDFAGPISDSVSLQILSAIRVDLVLAILFITEINYKEVATLFRKWLESVVTSCWLFNTFHAPVNDHREPSILRFLPDPWHYNVCGRIYHLSHSIRRL